jgi:hypothetical protein
MCLALFHLNQSSSWKMQLKNPSDLRRVPYALPSRKFWEDGRDCENRNIRRLTNFAKPVGLPRRHFKSPAAIHIPRGASRQPQLPEDQANQGNLFLCASRPTTPEDARNRYRITDIIYDQLVYSRL